MVQPGWKRVWRFAKELNVEVAYGSAVPLPGIDPPPVQANKPDAPVWAHRSVRALACACAIACEAGGGAGAGALAGVGASPGIA